VRQIKKKKKEGRKMEKERENRGNPGRMGLRKRKSMRGEIVLRIHQKGEKLLRDNKRVKGRLISDNAEWTG